MEPDAALIASLPLASERGRWQRHASSSHVADALNGRRGYGRWGVPGGFPVLYLGRPRKPVIVEAYGHLIDPIEEEHERAALLATIRPRTLVTGDVAVTALLDLRPAGARASAGISPGDVESPTYDEGAYRRCQHVAQIAHQLGRHGVIAPAATELG